MKKQRQIAVSCTTFEALENCIREQCPVIAMEEPLYSQGANLPANIDGFSDYSVTEYESMHFAMLVKMRGSNLFDSSQYEVYYFPLRGHRP